MTTTRLIPALLLAALATTAYADDDRPLPAASNAKWKAECGSCHVVYHPGLMTARSWDRVMAGLKDHFGSDATLDAASADEIRRFLVDNAADRSQHKRSRKIAASAGGADAPLRITESGWFQRKHDEVSPATFKRAKVGSAANCAACHPGAERGDFNEDAVRIPR